MILIYTMEFLKISLSRPRDIQRILKILQDLMKERNMGGQDKFSFEVYDSDRFQNMYSEYFLSSLKDQLSFYYSEEEYRHFKKFFDFFGSPEFSYNQYLTVHSKYVASLKDENKSVPPFVEDPKSFLQLLYDSNIIAAIDERGFFHFSYREKGPANIAPEVPYERSIRYIFHYGLYKKTKMGRYGGTKLDMEL